MTLTKKNSHNCSLANLFSGLMFAGTECLLDGYRGWHDWTTSPTTGFIVGGAMGLRAGIKEHIQSK